MKKVHVLLFLLIFGCTSSVTYTNRQKDIDKAKIISSKFYKFVSTHKRDSIFKYCSNSIRTDEQLDKQLQYILEQGLLRFGKIKDISAIQASSKIKKGIKPFGEYRLTYKVVRDKETTKENFILADEDGEIRIFTFND